MLLIKAYRGIHTATELRGRVGERTKRTLKQFVDGFNYYETKRVGMNAKKMDLWAGHKNLHNAYGSKVDQCHIGEIDRTAASLKSAVRRLRPQEAELLKEIDAKIKEAVAVVTTLRGERKALMSEAWTKAHVVRLAEIEPLEEKPRTLIDET